MLNRLLILAFLLFQTTGVLAQDESEASTEPKEPEVTESELKPSKSEDDGAGLRELAKDDTVGEVSLDDFVPSEEISADNSVAFPVDI